MNRSDQLTRENEALRDRLSRLSEAGRRINERLDLDEVLQEVLDSARALTGARYGVITPLEDEGIWRVPDGLLVCKKIIKYGYLRGRTPVTHVNKGFSTLNGGLGRLSFKILYDYGSNIIPKVLRPLS